MSVIQIQIPQKRLALSCTKCGSMADAACDCGSPYIPAKVRAAEAIAANPTKSDRAIAADIGVSAMTVQRARPTVTDVTVERMGLDGKVRRLPERQTEEVTDVAGLDSTAQQVISDLAIQYRKHTMAHTTHIALANKDVQRAGRALLEMKKFIETAGIDWWSFYSDHFDKSRRYAEQAMRAIETSNDGE